MHGGGKQNILEYTTFLHSLGLPHLSENYYWIHSFPVSIWHRSGLQIECEIPLLKLKVELMPHTYVEEEHFLHLTRLDETHRDATLVNETYQKWIKNQYDKSIHPRNFAEGDLVLIYDQAHDKLGTYDIFLSYIFWVCGWR